MTAANGGIAAITAQAIYGMGGIGKTRTAIEYAWQFQEDYSAVLFVRAESSSQLVTSLAGLTNLLPELARFNQSSDADRVQAVMEWLNKNEGWLVVFDNVDDEETAQSVQAMLPDLRGGHVLVTTRISKWKKVRGLNLDLLSEDAAASYLLDETIEHRVIETDDDPIARKLAREIGYLALGLEHAAAYINNHELSLTEYLSRFRENAKLVLAEYDTHLIDYPREILNTWQLSAKNLTENARRLLDLLSWFAADDIPEQLLHSLPDPFPVEHPEKALSELVRYSLAWRDRRQDPPQFGLHRLVQTATRHHLETAHSQSVSPGPDVLECALEWINVNAEGDPGDVRSWSVLNPLVAHAKSITEFAFEHKLVGQQHATSRLLNEFGRLALNKARYDEAEPMMWRALEIYEKAFGDDHPSVATSLNNLASLLKYTNRMTEAEPMMRRALKIDEKTFGEDHPKIAVRLNNLAQLLEATNRMSEAEPMMWRALEIDEKASGEDHPNVALRLNNLAQLLKATNRMTEAEPMMRRALKIDEKTSGEDHPKVALRLNNLALLLKATNRTTDAVPMMRRALEIFRSSLGNDHPRTTAASSNYRSLLGQMGLSDIEINERLDAIMNGE